MKATNLGVVKATNMGVLKTTQIRAVWNLGTSEPNSGMTKAIKIKVLCGGGFKLPRAQQYKEPTIRVRNNIWTQQYKDTFTTIYGARV